MKKEKSFKLTPQVLIRLVIFTFILFLSFNYLSSNSTYKIPNILGDFTLKPYTDSIYQQLPPDSRNLIENFYDNPTVKDVQSQLNNLKAQLNGFPETQIKEIQKTIVKNVSDKLIESIENK